MSGSPRWGVSLLDCRAHAVDEDAEHPYGVWVARCGQRLLRGTNLHEQPPPGDWVCLVCLRWAERGNPGEPEVRS